MTSVFTEMQSASFRGVPFLMEKESKTGGARGVVHEYPDSTKRDVESIGEIPPTFQMDCVIHGDNAIDDRIAFETALNDQTIGTLVHPIYGEVDVKVLAPYTVASNPTAIGEFRFNVKFATTRKKRTSADTAVDAGQVSADANMATSAVNDALEDSYKDPSFADSLTAAADKITSVTQAVNKQIVKVVEPIQKNVASFNRVVNAIDSGALTIMSQAFTVKQTVEDLFDGFRNLTELPQDLTESWKSLTDFNLFRDAPSTNTTKQAEIANNTRNLDTTARLNALAFAFESFAYTDFETDVEINDARKFLDEKFSDLISRTGQDVREGSVIDPETGDTVTGTIPIPALETTSASTYVDVKDIAGDSNVRSAFATLRVNTFSVLDTKEQNVFRIKDVNVYKSSMPLLTYQYFGDMENLTALENLNPSKNHACVKGETKMVTE